MTAETYKRNLDERAERELAMVHKLTHGETTPESIAPSTPHEYMARVRLIGANTLKPEPIRWLWPGWLARGKLHVLAGAPGTGKTTIAMTWAACISSGHPFPTGWKPSPGNVLVWSGEDDPRDTLVPRLLAAGADLSCVHFIEGIDDDGHSRPFDPATDVLELAGQAAKMGRVSMLVVDPVVSAVRGDSHKNAEVRRSLAPLVDLAIRLDAVLVGITHFTKGTGGRDPLERVTGSLAFGALARLVFGTCKQQGEEGEPQRMTLARVKSNIGPDGGGFAYAFEQTELEGHPGVEASRIVWGESIEGSARDLLAEPDPDDEGQDAASFLRDLLADGPMPTKDVKRQADDAGFAWRTVQRSMKRAGVVSQRGGFGQPAKWSIKVSHATVAPVTPHPESGANGATGGEMARLDGTDNGMEAFDL
ncbi:MAG TPA: AAA family ATPase [Rhodanobacteraceae bacterium]